MKVRLLQSISGEHQLSAGQIIDLDEMTAKYYVEHEKAEMVDETGTKAIRLSPPKVEKAVKVIAENQKKKR